MEVRQLRYLVALAEHGQFTLAAKAEHVAQPSLSQQIAKLERELGTPLVERGAKGITLTEAGSVMTVRARRALAELESARDEVDSLRELRTGRVGIGAMQTLGPVDLPLLLAEFHGLHPGIELAVRESLSEDLVELLLSDRIDIAFLSLTDRTRGGDELERQRLAVERIVVAMPPGHRLAGRRTIGMRMLEGEPMIAFREGAALRRLLIAGAAEAGFQPRITFESNEIPRILAMVGRGLGVSLLPETDVALASLPLASAFVTEPRLDRDVTLAWRRDRRLPPAAARFLEFAQGHRPDRDRDPR